IPVMFDSVPGVLAHIQSGSLRALGVTSKERVPQLKDVPTIAEAGVKDFEAISIFGLYGQKNMPATVLEKISYDVRNVLQSADIKHQVAALSATPGNMPQRQFNAYVNKENDNCAEVILQPNITLPKYHISQN